MPLVKSSCILLTCIIVHLFYIVLQNTLNPLMHHYLIYHPQTFLRMLVFGYLASNIAIHSSTSSTASNPCATTFSSLPPMSYGLCVIILEPYAGAIKKSMIGHTNVFWLGFMVPVHAMNITRTIPDTSHSQPLSSYRIKNRAKIPANHQRWKLLNSVSWTEDSRFRWQKSHWRWCREFPMATTTMSVLSWNIRNPLYISYHCNISLYSKFHVSCFALSCICKGSIHTEFHDNNYLLLHYSSVFYILTNTRECCIS